MTLFIKHNQPMAHITAIFMSLLRFALKMTPKQVPSEYEMELLSPSPKQKSMMPENVVLLHGLGRTGDSMQKLGRCFSDKGYKILNINYPSRKHPISELAAIVREKVIQMKSDAERVHFITHSMGGIILRYIQEHDPIPNLARVVMLSPPNHGSEVVDLLGNTWIFNFINGPAGKQLGTGKDGICRELGRVNFELGVITGDRSINLINSLMIPGKDDGKVSIESTKIEGMKDFLVVHATHPFIMKNEAVIAQCLYFLQNGRFKNKETK